MRPKWKNAVVFLGHFLWNNFRASLGKNPLHREKFARSYTYEFICRQQHMCGSAMECGVAEEHYETPHFHPQHQNSHPPGMSLPRTAWVRLNGFRTRKWRVAPSAARGFGAEEQIMTTLSFAIQSIDLPVECMAWRFWTMRQTNGCSAPAPRSSATYEWIKWTGWNDEEARGWPVDRDAVPLVPALDNAPIAVTYTVFTMAEGFDPTSTKTSHPLRTGGAVVLLCRMIRWIRHFRSIYGHATDVGHAHSWSCTTPCFFTILSGSFLTDLTTWSKQPT